MGKLKLTGIEPSYIINFLKYDDKKINETWVRNTAVFNIIVMIIATFFSGNKSFFLLYLFVICFVIIRSLIKFYKTRVFDKVHLYFYFGIYSSLFAVSFGTLGMQLVWRRIGQRVLWMIPIYLIIWMSVGCITYVKYIRRICRDYFKDNSQTPMTSAAGGAVLAAILSQIDGIDMILILGILILVMGITAASFIYFFIKSYCYSLIGEEEIKRLKSEKSKMRNMYIGYGKKKE